jgi:Ca-activated chloride channel family protein
LLLLPLLGIFIFRFVKWKKNKQKLFAETRFRQILFEKKSRFFTLFFPLYILAFAFLILSMADLMKNGEIIETKQKMNNVIFLLDVSNSMNTEDVEPSRLENAKNIIIQSIEKFKNDRVGVVVFAGEAISIMPLTTDYTAVDTYISGIETHVMKVQGTDFLKGMEIAARKFKNIPENSRKVILLSDGEDNEGNENAAIKKAKEEGIAVISVGIGTEEGAPIPEYVFGQLMGYKTDADGEIVISKRQTQALKNIAESTGGTYINGNNLDSATDEIIENIGKINASSTAMVKSQNAEHYYQYSLTASFFLFCVIYFFNPKKDFNV